MLLQNQGNLRVNLRGHVLVSQCAVENGDLSGAAFAFNQDTLIPAGMYVVLVSGHGEPRSIKTKEGSLIFYAYMNRNASVWDTASGPLHLLATQHTYATERAPALTLR